jgi:hypothetical protein
MRTIAFLTQKGGAGKTTLAASLAEVAASTGESVIALDLDPQQSLTRWGKRRESANVRYKVIVEPLERERLPRLRAILEGLAGAGLTLQPFARSPRLRTLPSCRRVRRVWMSRRRPRRFARCSWPSEKPHSFLTSARQVTAARAQAKRQSN